MNIKEKAKEFYKKHEDDIPAYCGILAASVTGTVLGYKLGAWHEFKLISTGMNRMFTVCPELRSQMTDAFIKTKQFYGV